MLENDPDAFGSSPEDHRKLSIEEIAARISDGVDKFVAGALAGERLIGTAGFFRDINVKERHKGHIWGVYVAREARGKGLGRRLMQFLLDRAVKTGVEQIQLAVGSNRQAAARLYRSLGFEIYGVERQALKINDHYVDEEHMVMFVDRAVIGPEPKQPNT